MIIIPDECWFCERCGYDLNQGRTQDGDCPKCGKGAHDSGKFSQEELEPRSTILNRHLAAKSAQFFQIWNNCRCGRCGGYVDANNICSGCRLVYDNKGRAYIK